MFVSYKWLQDYVDIQDVSAAVLAEKITRSGIEVEGVEQISAGMKGVVIGHVLACEQHPDADKLNICQVDVGDGTPKQIICGAPNVAAGQKVAVANVGAVLPGNFKIKKAKLRGEVSVGMICSLQELGIESKLVAKEFAEGIFVFPNEAEVGADALSYLNLDDEVLELGLTPNRADCLSMIGVAYEVAAILGRHVIWPSARVKETIEKTTDMINVTVAAAEDNPYYGARIVKNVKIGPSPLWLQNRLVAAGIRPISNVVDITNYILLEYGQPLHAFDYDQLGSQDILVRRAESGEEITTLDNQKRVLTTDHLVITNGKAPIAIAGVMGGANSEVSSETTTVLIESAVFHGGTVRKASKDHGLRSEASSRFEKGVDPVRAPLALDRAAQLMAELASGEVLQGVAEVSTLTKDQTHVSVSANRINAVLGTDIAEAEIGNIFNRLQFVFELESGMFHVNVPSRRGDITIPEDLIEEVARLYGYDQLPSTLPIGAAFPGKLTDRQQKRRKVRSFLEGAGLYQAVTYSLTSKDKVGKYLVDTEEHLRPIALSMPMSEERSMLRLSIVPHLLEVIAYNQARQNDDVAVYEIASVFLNQQEVLQDLPQESERLAGAITGQWLTHPWQAEKKAVDFFVVKGVLEGLFADLGVLDRIEFKQATKVGLHPGRTAFMLIDGQHLGFIGQIHPDEQRALDLDDTYVFELSLETLFSANIAGVSYEPIPRYPSITRDIALVVDQTTTAGEIRAVIIEAGGKLLKEVSIFDVYQGEHMEQGKKSLAFSLKYFDPEKTLTDEQVTKAHKNVLQAVEEKVGAKLRG